jgi:hypothetical protein
MDIVKKSTKENIMTDTDAILPDLKIRFHIEHPDLDECYTHGYEMSMAGEPEESSPYAIGTKEHIAWIEGWWAGFYGDVPLYPELLTSSATIIPPDESAANDETFHGLSDSIWTKWVKITGAIAVSAMVGYQILDLVA